MTVVRFRPAGRLAMAAIAAVIGVSTGCTGHGTGGDGWAIAGTTQARLCPARTPVEVCTAPYRPQSGTVRVVQNGSVIQEITTGADGAFRIAVAPGTYTVDAVTMTVQCPPQQVEVGGPPHATTIVVSCTVILP